MNVMKAKCHWCGKLKHFDTVVLELALRRALLELDALVDACVDAEGNMVAPNKKAFMRARGFLPVDSKHTLILKKK